jgi:hypothetical protein
MSWDAPRIRNAARTLMGEPDRPLQEVSMRRLVRATVIAAAISLSSVGLTLGHVHGITPLGCLDTDNPNSGAAAAQGHPIPAQGLIPNVLGKAELVIGTLGRASAPCR